MRLDDATAQKIRELRKQADEKKVWGNPTLNKRQVAFLLANALPTGGQILCWDAMTHDLTLMCIYEAVHFWCDPEQGLGNTFPREVIQVCEYILKNL